MPGSTAGRDDTDHFVRTILPIRMNHDDYDYFFNGSDCMPALFPAAYGFDEGDAKWVVENESCSFEINSVPFLVDLVLLFVPFESDHVYLLHSTYTHSNQERRST
jgi:hypothetical protein